MARQIDTMNLPCQTSISVSITIGSFNQRHQSSSIPARITRILFTSSNHSRASQKSRVPVAKDAKVSSMSLTRSARPRARGERPAFNRLR